MARWLPRRPIQIIRWSLAQSLSWPKPMKMRKKRWRLSSTISSCKRKRPTGAITPRRCGTSDRWCMGRTNIELDDALIAEVMRRYGVGTKREAVDLALRRLVGLPLTREFLQSLKGVGWGGDLDELRSAASPRIS